MSPAGSYVTMKEFVEKAIAFEIESAEFYRSIKAEPKLCGMPKA